MLTTDDKTAIGTAIILLVFCVIAAIKSRNKGNRFVKYKGGKRNDFCR